MALIYLPLVITRAPGFSQGRHPIILIIVKTLNNHDYLDNHNYHNDAGSRNSLIIHTLCVRAKLKWRLVVIFIFLGINYANFIINL